MPAEARPSPSDSEIPGGRPQLDPRLLAAKRHIESLFAPRKAPPDPDPDPDPETEAADEVWSWFLRPQEALAEAPPCLEFLQSPPRHLQAPGHEAPAVGIPKLLASTVDAMVRAVRMQLANLDVITDRALQILRRHASCRLELSSQGIAVDGVLGLRAQARQTAWLIPACMAGLRSLRARPELSAEGLARLARELAALEPEAASIERFNSWLWAGGAEGFEVELRQSLMETIDVLAWLDSGESPLPPRLEASLAASRLAGMRYQLSEQGSLTGRLADRIQAGDLNLSDVRQEGLRALVDDSHSWDLAEAACAVELAELRAAVDPRLVELGFLQLTQAGVGPELLRNCRTLLAEPRLAETLDLEGIGRALGRQISKKAARGPQLAELLGQAPLVLRRALLLELLERCVDDQGLVDVCAKLLGQVGSDGIEHLFDLPRLAPRPATGLIYALLALETGRRAGGGAAEAPDERKPLELRFQGIAARLAGVVAVLPAASTLAVLRTLPPYVGVHFAEIARGLLLHGPPELREELVVTLADPALNGNSNWAIWLLSEGLDQTRGEGWTSRALYGGLQACLDGGLGKNLVVLVHERSMPVALRAAALDVLSARPALLRQACRPRASDFLEPRALRASLEAARALLRSHDDA